jgi:hypothetical protein
VEDDLMKKLCLGSVFACMLDIACSNEIDVDLQDWGKKNRAEYVAERLAEPEEVRFQRDRGWWECYCRYDRDGFNSHDVSPLTTRLRGVVAGDLAAEGAMDIFLAAAYWDFTDYCVARLSLMSELNQQRFKEILILLAPGLESTRYKERAVRVVGRDQGEVTLTDLQNLQFCLNMFFCGAVKNAQWGRYPLARMLMNAFLAPSLEPGRDSVRDELYGAYNLRMIFEGCHFDGWPEIQYRSESVWPNWEGL